MSGLKPRRDPVSGRSVSLLVSQSLCSVPFVALTSANTDPVRVI
jgi:hypothetical protein